MTVLRRLCAAAFALSVASTALAQAPPDLMHATLEDLLNLEITSASRKEQRISDTAAAVYVITQEDIRRSGMSSLPEVLRMVPGVNVARINANAWAVSVRGFNDLYANKVMVMVDGRTIYNPLFAGVFWDAEDLMLEDVDRIEVIRGPGGATWGANAMNGVINVITKSAADTQGAAGHLRGSTESDGNAAVRYGGTFGRASYRVFSQWSSGDDPGQSLDTRSQLVTSGGRVDWSRVMLEGEFIGGNRHGQWLDLTRFHGLRTFDNPSDTAAGHALLRWSVPVQRGSLQIQSFFDSIDRSESVGDYDRWTGDADLTYHVGAGHHDVVVGGGYRSISETFEGKDTYVFSPNYQHINLFNVFGQDEIALAHDRLHVTLGAKAEHGNIEEDTDLQPTARAMWTFAPGTEHVWASISRAIRTPSFLDQALNLTAPFPMANSPLPVFTVVKGNPNVQAETVVDGEVGYRVEIGQRASLDVATFVSRYESLRTREPGSPSVVYTPFPHILQDVVFENLLNARTHGAEISGRVQLSTWWRVDGSFSAFHLTPESQNSRDPIAATYDGDAPGHQVRLHSAFTLNTRSEIDVAVWQVGALQQLAVPGYTRLDVRMQWPLTRSLSVAVTGQNLLNDRLYEFRGFADATPTAWTRRSAIGELRWSLR